MIRYILNRCIIAVREKKTWFFYAGIGVVLYVLYVLISPATHVISSSVNFNIDDSDRLISIPGRSVWRQLNRLVGSEHSFLVTQMNNIPSGLQQKIITEYTGDIQNQITRQNIGDAAIRQRPQAMILKFLSLNADNQNKKYIFEYRGDNYSLGIDLINYYTSRLVDHLFDGVYNRMEAAKVNTNQGYNKSIRDGKNISQISEGNRLSDDDIKIYKFLLERISTFRNSEPQITSGRDYSIKGLAINFMLTVIGSLFFMMLVIIIAEFSGKHLTSEVQVARYLNSHIIGTLHEIKSISGKE